MSIPTGYEKLAVIGIAWKGEYTQGTAYKTMNGVYYKGSTYVALRDNPTGPPAADGANWQYLSKGFEQQLLSAITALDTSGVLGEAGATVGGQALMDAIADKVMTKLVERSSIVQTESTDPTTVPSSPYFKQVTDRVISDFAGYINTSSVIADLTSDVIYTATENCIVAGSINLKMATYCYEQLNGQIIGTYSAPDNRNLYTSVYCPVKKGQTIKFQPSEAPHEFVVKAYRLLK